MEKKKDEESEVTEFNASSGSFDLLADEPDIYSLKDLKVVYQNLPINR